MQNRLATNNQPVRSENSLDELAKGLANRSVSRRGALKLVGGTILGGLLASIPGVAWAAPPCPSGVTCGPLPGERGGPVCCAIGENCVNGRCQTPLEQSCTPESRSDTASYSKAVINGAVACEVCCHHKRVACVSTDESAGTAICQCCPPGNFNCCT